MIPDTNFASNRDRLILNAMLPHYMVCSSTKHHCGSDMRVIKWLDRVASHFLCNIFSDVVQHSATRTNNVPLPTLAQIDHIRRQSRIAIPIALH